jgi:3-oxoadipate enol-lactonase
VRSPPTNASADASQAHERPHHHDRRWGPLHTRSDGHGDGPPLLLLNSLGTDLSMWDLQVPDWAATRRVVRFDQRGHGRSQTPRPP